LNLRRLLFFHHESQRGAARVVGVSAQTLGGWLAGRREPSTGKLFAIANLYDVDPSKLAGDPLVFAQIMANPDRIRRAEDNIAGAS
jgi:transcriptional regulator with XRE-family HTH domain